MLPVDIEERLQDVDCLQGFNVCTGESFLSSEGFLSALTGVDDLSWFCNVLYIPKKLEIRNSCF